MVQELIKQDRLTLFCTIIICQASIRFDNTALARFSTLELGWTVCGGNGREALEYLTEKLD